MKEREMLQEDFLKESEKVLQEPEKQEPKKKPEKQKINRWIDNEAKGVKTCPDCGGEIMGWAYRQNFHYCPLCGVENYKD